MIHIFGTRWCISPAKKTSTSANIAKFSHRATLQVYDPEQGGPVPRDRSTWAVWTKIWKSLRREDMMITMIGDYIIIGVMIIAIKKWFVMVIIGWLLWIVYGIVIIGLIDNKN